MVSAAVAFAHVKLICDELYVVALKVSGELRFAVVVKKKRSTKKAI